MSHDELIRRAMLHATPAVARPGYAVGGNPGDLATGGFGTGISGVAATARDVAAAVDRGNAMAAAREAGGNGQALGNRALGSPAANATYNGQPVKITPASDTAPVNPMDAFTRGSTQLKAAYGSTGFRGTPGMQVAGGTTPQSFSSTPASTPDTFDATMDQVRQIIGGTRRPVDNSVMPNLTGTNVSLTGLRNLQTPTTNFSVARNAFDASMPFNSQSVGQYLGATNPTNGPFTQKVNEAAKGDFLGNAFSTVTGHNLPTSAVAGQYTRTPADATYVKASAPAAPAIPAAPSIGTIKAAEYQAIADQIKADYQRLGLPISGTVAGKLAMGSLLPASDNIALAQDVKKSWEYTNTPEFLSKPVAARVAYQKALNAKTEQLMRVTGVKPGTQQPGSPSFAAFPSSMDAAYSGKTYGMTVNPSTKVATAPGYNVTGPYNFTSVDTTSPVYGKTYPQGYLGVTNKVNMANAMYGANPNYGVNTPAPPAANTAPTNIAGPGFTQLADRAAPMRYGNTVIAKTPDTFEGLGLYTGNQPSIGDIIAGATVPAARGIPPMAATNEMYSSLPSSRTIAGQPALDTMAAYMGSLPAARGPLAQATQYAAGPSPVSITQANPAPEYYATSSGPVQADPVAQALKIASASTQPEIVGGRQNDDLREQRVAERNQKNRLLALGYTQEQIDAMTPEQIREALLSAKNKTTPTAPTTPEPTTPAEPVVAAFGGRINYARGGEADTSNTAAADKSSNSSSTTTLNLPDLPAYKPYTLPTYTMPSASPLIANFINSLSQYGSTPLPSYGMAPGASSGVATNPAVYPVQSVPAVTTPTTPTVQTPVTSTPSVQPPTANPGEWQRHRGNNWWFKNRYNNDQPVNNDSITNALRWAGR